MRRLACLFALALVACSNPTPATPDGSAAEDLTGPGPDDLSAAADLSDPGDLRGVDLRGVPDMAFVSCCGKPGDTGNALGVGKYCTGIPDCSGTSQAKLCSSLGNTEMRKTYFCTFLCNKNTPGQCGTGASCQCDTRTGACACTPDSCVTSPPPGCSN